MAGSRLLCKSFVDSAKLQSLIFPVMTDKSQVKANALEKTSLCECEENCHRRKGNMLRVCCVHRKSGGKNPT